MQEILELIKVIWRWIEVGLLLGLALIVIYSMTMLFLRMRKAVMFEAWVNLSKDTPQDIGRSLADLLLFKIREVQSIHQKCIRQIGLWTPYYDVPVFQPEMEKELRLLASVELGNYGDKMTKLMMFLFRLVPMVFQPAKLTGHIHQYGDEILLHVTLENYRQKGSRARKTLIWHVSGKALAPEQFPQLVEELAYQIYVDLVGSSLFKSWQGFRAYTIALRHYLAYTNINNDQDFDEADRFYQDAVKTEPNNAAAYYNLGVLRYFLYQHDDNEKAIEYFQRALLSSDYRLKAQAHSALANALSTRYHRFKAGNENTLRDAIYHAQEAIKLDPSSDVANKALAYASHQFSEIKNLPEDVAKEYRERAINHYKKAYQINPKYFIAYNNLGNLYLEWSAKQTQERQRKKYLELAIAACNQALIIEPSYHHAYDNIGNAYFALKQLDTAEEYYKRALQYNPKYPEAKNDLAMLYVTRGLKRKDFAQEEFAQALALHIEALSMPQMKETQRKKLCNAFQQRLDGKPLTIDQFRQSFPTDIKRLQELGCGCVPPPTGKSSVKTSERSEGVERN